MKHFPKAPVNKPLIQPGFLHTDKKLKHSDLIAYKINFLWSESFLSKIAHFMIKSGSQGSLFCILCYGMKGWEKNAFQFPKSDVLLSSKRKHLEALTMQYALSKKERSVSTTNQKEAHPKKAFSPLSFHHYYRQTAPDKHGPNDP